MRIGIMNKKDLIFGLGVLFTIMSIILGIIAIVSFILGTDLANVILITLGALISAVSSNAFLNKGVEHSGSYK